jgi:hypothetical protein
MSTPLTAERRDELDALHRAVEVKGDQGRDFHARLLGRTSVRGEQGCRTLASVLCKGTVLGGSRRFLGSRLELLSRLRRLEVAVVARKPVGKGVGRRKASVGAHDIASSSLYALGP